MDSVFFDDFVGTLGSTCPDVDPLALLHKRTGDSTVGILREAVRTQVIEGVSLPRSCFITKKSKKKFKCLCDVCARAKITRHSFPEVRDRMKGLRPGDVVSADILLMLNIPSRENYRYVLHIIDHATKQSWVYPLKTRESKELLVALKQIVEDDLPKLNILTVAVSSLRKKCCSFFTALTSTLHTHLVIRQR